MFDAISILGPGYKAPSYDGLRGPILQNENADCILRLEEFWASWEHTGCTVMLDGWTDQESRILINFFINCFNWKMFMKLVYTFAHIKDA